MANKILLFVLLFSTQLFLEKSFAGNGQPVEGGGASTTNLDCNAPAPDSFWVSARGGYFITADWTGVSLGATYTLKVYTRSNADMPWYLFESFSSLSGTSVTVYGVSISDECKMTIQTNCSDGTPSIYSKSLWDKIIIELSTGGRIPINPVPISCKSLPAPNGTINWVGFQVAQNTGFAIKNVFEVLVIHDPIGLTVIKINRVYENNVVFAANNAGVIPPPKAESGGDFLIVKKLVGQIPNLIGSLLVTKNGALIDLCPNPDVPWDNSYSFVPLMSTMVYGFDAPIITESAFYEPDYNSIQTRSVINVESPFNETLSIFMEKKKKNQGNIKLRIIDIYGKIVLNQQEQITSDNILIPTSTLPSGLYILLIEKDSEMQTFRIIKGGNF